jgi:hypothetical protein
MKRRHLAPFMYELRETVATARYRFKQLDEAAEQWKSHEVSADAIMAAGRDDFDDDQFTAEMSGSRSQQGAMFEALEAFLAAWARVSLLLFPTHGDKARGKALRDVLALEKLAVLDDRELRDAWMHFDERLDAAVRAGPSFNRHKWTRSITAEISSVRTLRLFDVDTLTVHFRDRAAASRSADLRAYAAALEDVENAWQGAWSRIPT